mgnify:CR=1 FL=1
MLPRSQSSNEGKKQKNTLKIKIKSETNHLTFRLILCFFGMFQVGLPPVGLSKLSEVCKATRHVIKSLPLICITLAGCTESFLLVGIGHFMPKILHVQFQFPVNEAGMMFGVVAGVSAIGGNLIGMLQYSSLIQLFLLRCTKSALP